MHRKESDFCISAMALICRHMRMGDHRKRDSEQELRTLQALLQWQKRFIKIAMRCRKYNRNGASDRLPGNLSLSFKGMDGESILHRLDLMGICVSTGAACDSVHTQISHVLRAIHMPEDLAKGTIRISLGRENTDELGIVG